MSDRFDTALGMEFADALRPLLKQALKDYDPSHVMPSLALGVVAALGSLVPAGVRPVSLEAIAVFVREWVDRAKMVE